MNIIDGTTEFHKLAGFPTGEYMHPDGERTMTGSLPMTAEAYDELIELRRSLMDEETDEYWNKGEYPEDIVEIIDACLDIIVIAWGTVLSYVGQELGEAAAEEVVRSNLSKVDGSLGEVKRRGDGKILKPEGWTPPNIAGALGL